MAGDRRRIPDCLIWQVADVASLGLTAPIVGLRRNGKRSIRARYPNGNPELSGDWLVGAGQSMGGGDYTKGCALAVLISCVLWSCVSSSVLE
jgi:hypothetical protein